MISEEPEECLSSQGKQRCNDGRCLWVYESCKLFLLSVSKPLGGLARIHV